MADLPSISLAALAMALSFHYLRSGERRWLIFSGLALSASLLIKLFALFTFIPIALVVFWRLSRGDVPPSRMDFVKEIGLLAVSIALPVLFCLLIYDPQYLYDQMLAFPLQAKKAFPLNVAFNWQAIWNYLHENYGLLSLAIFGGLLLLAKRCAGGMIIISWLILATAGLLTHSPLWPHHHLIVLLLPLAVLGGVAIGDVWDRLRRLAAPIASQRMLPLLMGLCAVAFYFSALPVTLKRDVELSVGPRTEIGEEAVRSISAVTNPDDFVITDEQMIAFRARRRVPPLLCDTSGKRIHSGYLTANQLIEVSRKYDAPVVLLWSGRFAQLPEYVRWVEANYCLVKSYSARHHIYLKVQHPMQVNLGDKITFLGYDLHSAVLKPGSKILLTLYWRAEQLMETSYTVFTHFIDAKGRIWGQQDNPPMRGLHPTTNWTEGEVITDQYEIPLKPDAPPGKYMIEVGMYEFETGEKLPVFDEERKRVPEERILLDRKMLVGKWGIQHPMQVNLGDKITFLGYDLKETEVEPGGTLYLTLYWQARTEMDTSYTVFTHLIDAHGCIWGQKDNLPCSGEAPTTGWLEGEVIVDEYEILVRPDAPPGKYRIEVGMYLLESMERLAVIDEDRERLSEDRVLLEPTIIVENQ